MATTYCAWYHADWDAAGLADFADFGDMATYCNQGEDAFSGYGDWFYAPDEPLPDGSQVIYFGSWGNDNSPGASCYTYAHVYTPDDEGREEHARDLAEYESYPEYLPCEEEEFVEE